MQVCDLPSRGAKDAVVANQRRSVALIRPRVTAAMQVEIAELLAGDETPKSTHDAVVEAGVVLVGGGGNHVEVAAKEPRANAGFAHVVQVSEELELSIVIVRSVNSGEPPVAIAGERGD